VLIERRLSLALRLLTPRCSSWVSPPAGGCPVLLLAYVVILDNAVISSCTTFIENYLQWSRANKKPRSYERDRTSPVAPSPFFTGKMLSDIAPWLIENYKKERKEKGGSSETINLEVACLTATFSKAVTWKKAIENPTKEVKVLKLNNARVRFLDEEEYRLLAECKEHFMLWS
jgi:site-specific recombinase XerD